jgi:hypothetical protein
VRPSPKPDTEYFGSFGLRVYRRGTAAPSDATVECVWRTDDGQEHVLSTIHAYRRVEDVRDGDPPHKKVILDRANAAALGDFLKRNNFDLDTLPDPLRQWLQHPERAPQQAENSPYRRVWDGNGTPVRIERDPYGRLLATEFPKETIGHPADAVGGLLGAPVRGGAPASVHQASGGPPLPAGPAGSGYLKELKQYLDSLDSTPGVNAGRVLTIMMQGGPGALPWKDINKGALLLNRARLRYDPTFNEIVFTPGFGAGAGDRRLGGLHMVPNVARNRKAPTVFIVGPDDPVISAIRAARPGQRVVMTSDRTSDLSGLTDWQGNTVLEPRLELPYSQFGQYIPPELKHDLLNFDLSRSRLISIITGGRTAPPPAPGARAP